MWGRSVFYSSLSFQQLRLPPPILGGIVFRNAPLLTNPYSQLSRPILFTTHHIRGDQATHEIKKNSKFNPYGCCAVVGRGGRQVGVHMQATVRTCAPKHARAAISSAPETAMQARATRLSAPAAPRQLEQPATPRHARVAPGKTLHEHSSRVKIMDLRCESISVGSEQLDVLSKGKGLGSEPMD